MCKVVVRIRGGIGNQLFCYAAARRMALVNDAKLVIDDVSGFVRDKEYRRSYMLDRFNIAGRKATAAERLEPFESYRRFVMRSLSRRMPFNRRRYIEQEGTSFDDRLLNLRVKGTVYLDGLWQSEGYFKDAESEIRTDLGINPPSDDANQRAFESIHESQAVALHVRWFDIPGRPATHNLTADYYQRAVAMMEQALESPKYFVFSDNPDCSILKLNLPENRFVVVSHNQHEPSAYADLWLMSQCKHFIIANSTFSWWAAWLGNFSEKLVMTPNVEMSGKTAWGFKGLIPEGWLRI